MSSLNNFRQLINPTSDFNRAQVEGLFILRNHRGPVVLAKNKFRDNITYNGLLSVDKIEGAFAVSDNKFSSNSALLESSAISFTVGGSLVSGSTTES